MSILDRGIGGLGQLGGKVRRWRIERLLSGTKLAKKKFLSEAKRLGIEVQNINLRNYYELLGLKYTGDQKSIKDAYIRMVKLYHPDVSEDSMATQKMESINEAYAVLKDRDKKAEYDAKFSRGNNRMSADTTKILYSELLSRYQKVRSADFEEFNKRVAMPQDANSIKASIAEVTNWQKRFRQVSDNMFGNFRDYGRKLRHLEGTNRSLLKGEKDASTRSELDENLQDLQGLVQAFKEADKGIDGVVDSILNDIEVEENNLTDRLRRSVS
jgi:curved DNA-binding protein CbpA